LCWRFVCPFVFVLPRKLAREILLPWRWICLSMREQKKTWAWTRTRTRMHPDMALYSDLDVDANVDAEEAVSREPALGNLLRHVHVRSSGDAAC
jgi:hypothetical protein